ncbi:hypothetical protein SLE2022_384900 [Rubroshorea leprosula]
MASLGALKVFLGFHLWLSTLSLSQGIKYLYPYRYPFIKRASSFSSPASFSANGGENAYDYIIVGGGTAGCPLAATLSQNFSVLLLERDGVINARARVLGGGTCINAGFYTRANPEFIERVGWDAKLVNESYPWVEKQMVHRPNLAEWQAAFKEGLLEVGVSPYNGFTYDHIYGTKIGGTIFDRFGRRHTAAELLAYANPKKLTVLIYATVQKVVFDTRGKQPKAVGVIFKDENGQNHRAVLSGNERSEVILSSGAIGTPQMLMLSGVGPKVELEKLNISVVLDNEFVASSGFGQSQDSIRCHHGILSAEIGQLSTIPPKQRSKEAIQAYTKRKRELPHEAFKGGFILEKIATPISTGQLNLVNTNVDDNPSVTFNYFSHPHDLQRCVDGIRMAAKIIQSDHFTNYTKFDKRTVEQLLNISVKANINFIPKHTNDTKSLKQFCKDTVITIWHYHGGCHVGKVVDPDHKVLGIQRLRIVDGSTFNESPGTNPQGTVLMMGRYLGVKILRERLGKAANV